MGHYEEFYSQTFGATMLQVNKTKARKLFMEGRTIYLHPSKLRFDNIWQSPAAISNDGTFDTSIGISAFDNAVNHYENYNCNGETGKYAHYYIQK